MVTFIHDIKSEQFINFILKDLKKDYKIINCFSGVDRLSTVDLDDDIEDNSIILMKFLTYDEISNDPDPIQRMMYRKKIDNQIRSLASKIRDKNIIIINLTSNTNFYGVDVYSSDTVFLLKNNELSFLKKRTVNYETDKFNINQLLRSVKLKIVNKSQL